MTKDLVHQTDAYFQNWLSKATGSETSIMPNPADALKPCPFCGASDVSQDAWSVKCLDCGSEMPGDPSRAREAWNRRALTASPAQDEALNGARPLPIDRETLGRMVREAWVRWAQTQPDPKLSWLAPYDELSEPDKEADRQIGEAIARWTLIHDAARLSLNPPVTAPDDIGRLSVDDIERIILNTEPAGMSDRDDQIWTRRMAVALQAKLSTALLSQQSEINRLREALEGTLSWLTSYPGGGAMKAYDRARAALPKAST